MSYAPTECVVWGRVGTVRQCLRRRWGRETKYIAEELGVSWYTARNHIENLRKKLGVSSRLEAVMVAMRLRILPSE